MLRSLSLYVLPGAAAAMLSVATFHVAKEQRPMEPLRPIQTPARRAFSSTVAATGVAEARTENIMIGSALDGIVEEVYVPSSRVGARVAVGAPLFRVDDRRLRANWPSPNHKSRRRRRSWPGWSSSLARRSCRQPKLAFVLPRRRRTRRKTPSSALNDCTSAMRLPSKISSPSDWPAKPQGTTRRQPRPNWRCSKPAPGSRTRRLPAPHLSKRRRKRNKSAPRSSGRWSAPVDGEVLQVNVRVGERVSTASAEALVVLGDVRTMHIRAEIDENDIPRFRKDSPAVAYVRGDAERKYHLRFERVEPMVVAKKALSGENTERQDTRVLQAIYAVEDTHAPLYVGQQLDVFIEGARHSPSAAAVAPLK